MKWMVVRSVAVGTAAFMLALSPAMTRADSPSQPTPSPDQLKTQAFVDLRSGKFDESNQLLAEAASISGDPTLKKMSDWTHSFDVQEQGFASERHKQFEKRVDEMHLLISKNLPEDALERAALAYLLADDKEAFRKQKDVDDLVATEEIRANQFIQDQQWIQAQRIYQDLSQIDPGEPKWKIDLKSATRREQLLALYTPTLFRKLLDADTKLRLASEALINPTTQPTSQPATQPVADADDDTAYKVDWHEILHGIKPDMLWEAILFARNNWYRDVSYKTLGLGGLDAIKAITETRGLEQAFPRLADQKSRDSFVATIDQCVNDMKSSDGVGEQTTLQGVLQKLELSNQATVALPEEVLVAEFANGAFGKLDAFSTILWPSDMDDFRRTTQGEFSGVGIQIRSDPDGSLRVVTPLPDTPAMKAGILPEDTIVRINGKSAKGITTTQAVRSITGPKGTPVVLTIKSPNGNVRDYTLTRQTITIASIKGWLPTKNGWNYFVDPDQKIAYIRLTNFAGNTPQELNDALEQIQAAGARGIIIDLRYDPGGLLDSATKIADRFLHDGVIVSTHPDRDTGDSPWVAVAKPDRDDVDLPLVILVNQYSASASEILSGALKDQKRAIIVGERSFGKGSVQKLFPLTDKSAYFKLTTSHYYLPSGRCLHREENSLTWGVDPDVEVPMTPEQMGQMNLARQNMDVIPDLLPAASAPTTAPADVATSSPTTAPGSSPTAKRTDLLGVDPQLSAALLILRLKLNGANL